MPAGWLLLQEVARLAGRKEFDYLVIESTGEWAAGPGTCTPLTPIVLALLASCAAGFACLGSRCWRPRLPLSIATLSARPLAVNSHMM